MATERALFIPKKYRKWAEEVLKVQDPAELAKLYAESKAHRDEWRKSSGIAEWNRKHREERRPHHEAVAAPLELAIVGDLTDNEGELTNQILGVAPGAECTIYFDSPGGSPYCAMSLVTLLRLRTINATAIVTGECSSAALWPFATCRRRLVTPYSVFLFHPMKWQSEEHIGIREAAEWSRHFADLEREMDVLLCQLFGRASDLISQWIRTHRYVTGKEMAEAGLAELISLDPLPIFSGRG